MDFKVSNVGKPRHPFWKKLTRYLVITLPLYMGAITQIEFTNPDTGKWIMFGLAMLTASVQGLSEFTAEPETPKTDDITV